MISNNKLMSTNSIKLIPIESGIILKTSSGRYYFHSKDIKIDAHGFKKINGLEIITSKILSNDFAYYNVNESFDTLTLWF